MKIPETPPDTTKTFNKVLKDNDSEKISKFLNWIQPTDAKGRYLHWDKLRHLNPPEGWTVKEWWAAIKFARGKLHRKIDLLDVNQNPFVYATPDCIQKDLHELAKNAAGNLTSNKEIINPDLRKTYLIRSLINEAINSSQLEGAATTRNVAKEMIRQGSKPKNTSEQMIKNNFLAMQFITDIKEEPLTPSIIIELHKILTQNTLKKEESAGKFRTEEDEIIVVDPLDGALLHTPPKSDELPERIEKLCRFANEEDPQVFINPLVKAIILHFALAYDHPFVDGNGRTARALFYWFAARQGYDLIQFSSISKVLKDEPGKYKRAFLFSENDENDLTYFIDHQISVIKKCMDILFEYLKKESEEIEEAEKQLEGEKHLTRLLNYRQIALLRHALKSPKYVYTAYGHQNTHGIAYETARKDLMDMAKKWGLLDTHKDGRTFIFEVPLDLRERIERAKR
ncbi:MAG: Fic family protein [Nitrospina sp.]|nr:Fic family protein [Nitrospina sp.]MBT6717189.1 Fic family protein [Nitrospina sp.]